MDKKFKEIDKENYEMIDAEFDLKIFFRTLLRNKQTIIKSALFFFILACIFSLFKKRLWEGQFEIVINTENPVSSAMVSEKYQKFLPNNNNSLKTEVGILESPSVLMPVFNYIKTKEPYSRNKNLSFSSWKTKNLDIKLKKSTSILKISYRDFNKDQIVYVLNNVSSLYQDYSGQRKKRTQDLLKKYLEEQITIFKEKSSQSLKLAQDYAIDQDLILLSLSETNLTPQNIDIENIRVSAANEIRKINSQIKKIKDLNDDFEKTQYIASTIPELKEEGITQTLKKLEEDLILARLKYTNQDKTIEQLLEKRLFTTDLLKKRAIGNLEAKKIFTESVMESAIRPKGVLLKYKELIRDAARDENTLINLENELNLINLEQAKKEDPWQLITKPTLLDTPVSPRRKKLGTLGLLFGLFAGSIFAIIKEKRSGIVFDTKILENLLSAPLLERINQSEIQKNNNKIKFIIEFFKNLEEEKITLITFGISNIGINNSLIKFKEILSNNVKKELNIIDLNQENENFEIYPLNIIFTALEGIKYNEIIDLNKKLKLLKSSTKGIYLLDN